MANETVTKRHIQLVSTLQSFARSYRRIYSNRIDKDAGNPTSLEINLKYKCLKAWNEVNDLINVPEDFNRLDNVYINDVNSKLKFMGVDKKEFFEDIKYLYGLNSVNKLFLFIHNTEIVKSS